MSDTKSETDFIAEPADYCERMGDCRLCPNPSGNCLCPHHAPQEICDAKCENCEPPCRCFYAPKHTGKHDHACQFREDEIGVSFRKGCPTCLSPQPHLHPAVQFEGEVSICKDAFHSQVTPQNPKVEMPTGLIWGEQHQRAGGTHIEWHVPCGCAYHPSPFPHVHPCSDEHKRPDLHASAQEQAIVTAAREWAIAWGNVWESDESATTEAVNEVNDKSKALHDAVLDLERIRGKQ